MIFNRTRIFAAEGEPAQICLMLQSASLDRQLTLELQTNSDTATGESLHGGYDSVISYEHIHSFSF